MTIIFLLCVGLYIFLVPFTPWLVLLLLLLMWGITPEMGTKGTRETSWKIYDMRIVFFLSFCDSCCFFEYFCTVFVSWWLVFGHRLFCRRRGQCVSALVLRWKNQKEKASRRKSLKRKKISRFGNARPSVTWPPCSSAGQSGCKEVFNCATIHYYSLTLERLLLDLTSVFTNLVSIYICLFHEIRTIRFGVIALFMPTTKDVYFFLFSISLYENVFIKYVCKQKDDFFFRQACNVPSRQKKRGKHFGCSSLVHKFFLDCVPVNVDLFIGINDDDVWGFLNVTMFHFVCFRYTVYLFSELDETRYRLRPAELLQVFAPVGDHHVDVWIVLDR